VWAVAVAVVLVVVLLTVARGPVALLAAATVAVLTAFVLGLPPLLRPDGIDWDWRPGGVEELRPEPGIANLYRLLEPAPTDTEAPVRLHELVTALAADRAPHGVPPGGALAAYLTSPPRRLSATETDTLITELEALSAKESS
jgi:hypothetical protein